MPSVAAKAGVKLGDENRSPDSVGVKTPDISKEQTSDDQHSEDGDAAVESTSSSGASDSEGELADAAGNNTVATRSPPTGDIQGRLASFFSQLAEQRASGQHVDEVIEEGSSDSGYEGEEDGRQYVELNLALGVLSQDAAENASDIRLPHLHDGSASSSSGGDDEDDKAEEGVPGLDKLKSVATPSQSHAPSKRHKRKIEELG